MNDFVQVEKMVPVSDGLIEIPKDALEAYGPICRVVTIGDDVSMEMKLEIGDYVICNHHLALESMANGVLYSFVKAAGIIAKMTKEEAEAPLMLDRPSLIIQPKDAIEVN